MVFESLKDQYIKVMADAVSISVEDLATTEIVIIEKGFDLFSVKIDDIKIANDEIKRLSIELANFKAMTDDKYERGDDNYKRSTCPTCGRDESFRNDF